MVRSRFALARLSEPLLLVLLLLITATTTRPTIDFVSKRSLLDQPKRAPSELHPRSHTEDPHMILNANPLRERMMPGVTPVLPAIKTTIKMNMLHFSKLGVALLSSSADFTEAMRETTRQLQNFYMDIAYKAQDEWSQLPEVSDFFIDDPQGRVRLTLRCVGDTIPWQFVKDMAERLFETAAMGMANLFEVIYGDEMSTIGVRISLDLIDSSSGSGSGSGTREGSVPSITSPKD